MVSIIRTTRIVHETVPHIRDNTISNHNSNVFIHNEITIADKEKEFGPGEFKYPFSFQLPLNLPTSFENLDGHIRYWLRASLDVPWSKTKYIYQNLTVISRFDLNEIPGIGEACSARDEFTYTKLFSKDGTVYVNLNLKKSNIRVKKYLFSQ